MMLAAICVAATLLTWEEPGYVGTGPFHYEATLNGFPVYSGTDTSADIGPGCGIACVRAVNDAGPGPWTCLLSYGPCAVNCAASFAVKGEQQGCCPAGRTPWQP